MDKTPTRIRVGIMGANPDRGWAATGQRQTLGGT
jgi:hypothetical protein